MRIFFVILHKLLLLALAVYWLGELVLTKLREFLNSGDQDDLDRDRRYIEHKIRNLDRSPVHLAILLGNEAPQYGTLGKLIIWAATAGIQHISLYDHEGKYVARQQEQHTYVYVYCLYSLKLGLIRKGYYFLCYRCSEET